MYQPINLMKITLKCKIMVLLSCSISLTSRFIFRHKGVLLVLKIITKVLITLFGAILIFSDLKENNTWLFSFWIVLALYMIFEGFLMNKKNPQ